VFRLEYFGEPACLAQSPQLYKQMCAACSDFERVFEIGPVFRAESSNTHRHLTEFHGMDLEMVINEHYYEVLDLFSDLFIYIFEQLKARFSKEIEAVRAQFPFEDLQVCSSCLRGLASRMSSCDVGMGSTLLFALRAVLQAVAALELCRGDCVVERGWFPSIRR
jgi:hypothetical protein